MAITDRWELTFQIIFSLFRHSMKDRLLSQGLVNCKCCNRGTKTPLKKAFLNMLMFITDLGMALLPFSWNC